jgi:hypothetical protein
MNFLKKINRVPLALAGLLCAACSSAVDSAALARVSDGMKVEQVEAILGRPTHIDQSEIPDMGGIIDGKVYDYSSPGGEARVVFVNNTVFRTEFIPPGKHA